MKNGGFYLKMTKKVMCFGTFDLLHLGHLNYFKQAKRYGDYLIIVVARDKTKKDQKKTTVFTEKERLKLIQSLKIVDEAVLGYQENHFKIIQEKKPGIICLGYDHSIKETYLSEELMKLNLCPQILRMKPFRSESNKSSKIRNLILKKS